MFGPRDIALDVLAPPAFTTLADVKGFLAIADTNSDALLTGFLLPVAELIEKYCNRLIAQRVVTETLFPDDPLTNIVLTHNPVIAVQSVSLTLDGATTPATLADFYVAKASGIMRRADGATVTAQRITVTYTAGYATTPSAVAQAAASLTKWLKEQREAPANVTSETLEGVGSTSYAMAGTNLMKNNGAAVPYDVAAALSPYVRRFVP